jgi:hypothetical protein
MQIMVYVRYVRIACEALNRQTKYESKIFKLQRRPQQRENNLGINQTIIEEHDECVNHYAHNTHTHTHSKIHPVKE